MEKKATLDITGSDVFVNAAGGMRLDEPAADLPIAAALASSFIDRPLPADTVLFGELGLGGEIRAVVGAPSRIAEAAQLGFKRVILPEGNRAEAEGASGVELVGVSTIQELLDTLF